jgi:hypothetical protein
VRRTLEAVRTSRIREALRRWCRVLALVATLPIACGSSWGVLVRALGAEHDHHCACGMVRGKCGCPECERIEAGRQSGDDIVARIAVLRGTCGEVEALSPPQCLAVLPSAITVAKVLRAQRERIRCLVPALPSRAREGPPDPPPRDG